MLDNFLLSSLDDGGDLFDSQVVYRLSFDASRPLFRYDWLRLFV